MTIEVRDAGTFKVATPSVKDDGVWKEVTEGYVKDDGTWKQFIYSIPFGIYQGGYLISDILVYNYPFPNYGSAVSIDGEDNGTGPYTYQWSGSGNLTIIGSSTNRAVSFEVTPYYAGSLTCQITGANSVVRNASIVIEVSPNDTP